MLTETQLQALPLQVQGHFQRLESEIIQTICRHLREIGDLSETDVYKLDQLRRIGYDLEEIQREIAQTLKVTQGEVYDAFRTASEIEYMGAKHNFDLTGTRFIPFSENQQLQMLLESISRATVEEMVNFSRTTGFVNTAGAWQPIAQYYQQTVDYAVLQVRTGQADFHTAMHKTINAMADNGQRFVQYNNEGKRPYTRRLDTAVRANMMDGAARLSIAQAELVGAQFGADGMEVSWHSGARPSHVWIGGIQVPMDEFYRDVQPVMNEPNCYHRAHGIVMGISPPIYAQSELERMNAHDAETHEFQDKEYNAYQAQQRQREYETEIRKYKDRAMAYDAEKDADMATVARARQRAVQAEYRQFSDAMEIKAKPTRTRVSKYR